MGLNRSHALYTPKWQAGLRRGTEATMPAQIALFRVSGQEYDLETDTWEQVTETWYTGKARVQPVRIARTANAEGNATTIQAITLSIPIANNAVDFRPGLQGHVLECELNPSLTEYEFFVQDVVDGSNPFETTLTLSVNQEDTPDG